MALFRVSNNRAQFDAAGNDASDQYGAGIRFTQGGNARVTTGSATNYNQGIPMSATGQVAIVDATAGLPAGTIFHNGLPISGDKVCVSRNATAVVSNGLPFDSAGAVAADVNLDLNFIGTDTLNSSVTFTRASTGTFFNSAGVLTSAAINAPRFDYNPATLAARGLLIEEQRTNLTLQSEDFATTWTVGPGVTVSTNATTAPSGTTTADKLQEDATTGSHLVTQTITFTAATHTASVFAKKAERDWIRVLFFDGTNTFSGFFNLTAGTVGTLTGTGTTATIAAVGNGWYRCTVTATTAAGSGSFAPRIALADGNSSYTGVTGNGIFIWGAQLEAGAFPTSYIPTTTTALTRSADVASVNTLSPWYNATEGTLYVEAVSPKPNGTERFPTILEGSTFNDRMVVGVASTNQFQTFYATGGATQANLTTGTYTPGDVFKIASAYKTNDIAQSANGAAVQTDASATLMTPTQLRIGLVNVTYLGGWVRRLTYYPRRLSNAELVSITTP